MLHAKPDPRLAPGTPTHSCLQPIPCAQAIALLYPKQALDQRQHIYAHTSFHQHRYRFMHHRALQPVPEPYSISIDPRQITASA